MKFAYRLFLFVAICVACSPESVNPLQNSLQNSIEVNLDALNYKMSMFAALHAENPKKGEKYYNQADAVYTSLDDFKLDLDSNHNVDRLTDLFKSFYKKATSIESIDYPGKFPELPNPENIEDLKLALYAEAVAVGYSVLKELSYNIGWCGGYSVISADSTYSTNDSTTVEVFMPTPYILKENIRNIRFNTDTEQKIEDFSIHKIIPGRTKLAFPKLKPGSYEIIADAYYSVGLADLQQGELYLKFDVE